MTSCARVLLLNFILGAAEGEVGEVYLSFTVAATIGMKFKAKLETLDDIRCLLRRSYRPK